jgi:hypothetical protein
MTDHELVEELGLQVGANDPGCEVSENIKLYLAAKAALK